MLDNLSSQDIKTCLLVFIWPQNWFTFYFSLYLFWWFHQNYIIQLQKLAS